MFSIVSKCKGKGKEATQTNIVKEFMRSVFSDFDAKDYTISNLACGKKNPSPEYMEKFEKLMKDDYQGVVEDIEDNLIRLLNDNEHKLIIDAIGLLIAEDNTIKPDTIVEVISGTIKDCILTTEAGIATFLAGVFLYTLKNTDNQRETGFAKECADTYIEKAKEYQRQKLQMTDKESENIRIDTIKQCDLSKERFFSEDCFSAVGTAILIGKWKETNRYDLAFIEALTGVPYIDFGENLRVCENIDIIHQGDICSVKFSLETRTNLITEIYEKHLKMFFDRFWEELLRTTEFSGMSDELLDSVFDFIAFTGCNIEKCKRIDRGQWQNLLCAFARQIFQSSSKAAVGTLIRYYELFEEGSPKIAMYLISEQTRKENSTLANLLIKDKNQSVTYFLADAIRKMAASRDTFPSAMNLLMELTKYNEFFFKSMTYVMKTDYIQTEAEFKKKQGIIKKLSRMDSDIAWRFVVSILPGNTAYVLEHREFRYLPLGTHKLTNEEFENDVNSYICFLCNNLTDDVEKVSQMLHIMQESTDGNVKTIADAIQTKCQKCKSSEKLYQIVFHLAENCKDYSEDRVRILNELMDFFQPAKEMFEKKKMFSARGFVINKKTDTTSEDRCILSIMTESGIEGLISYALSVEDFISVSNAMYRNLDRNEYFKLLNECLEEENKVLRGYVINAMQDEDVIMYCKNICPAKYKMDILHTRAVSNSIIDYIDTLKKNEADKYWKNAEMFGIGNLTTDKYEYMIEKTMECRNFNTALKLIFWKVEKKEINFNQIFNVLEQYEINEENDEHVSQNELCYEIQIMLRILQDSDGVNIDRVAGLEEKYMDCFRLYEIASPKCIYYKMANNPEYVYAMILKRNKSVTEGYFNQSLYSLFYHFKTVPGTQMDGTLDYKMTMEWYEYAKCVQDEAIQKEMLDMFGKTIFHTGADEDGFVIDRRVAEFLENQADEDLLRSFEMEAFNSQKAYIISEESHDLEDIIAKYERMANTCEEEGYINVANSYRSIAGIYKLEHERIIGENQLKKEIDAFR